MAESNGFPKYQWSFFPHGDNGEQYVARSDSYEGFKEARKNILDLIDFPAKVTQEKLEKTTKELKTKECECGAIKTLKTGVSKQGKKWAGWFCDDKQCGFSPEWVNLTKK